MFGQTFTHDILRKYVILFGTLFNDIYIARSNAAGGTTQTIKVPLTYGPKEKFLARVGQDGSLDRPIAAHLPMMSFEMTTMMYDAARKLRTTQRLSKVKTVGDTEEVSYSYEPVPYDINFRLSILVKNAVDGTRIVEQIMPFFTPEWTVSIDVFPEMGIARDVPISLVGVNMEDVYEGQFEERRALSWDMDFVMKGYLYGPVKESAIIKQVETNFYSNLTANNLGSNTYNMKVTTTPGLTSNGIATSNADASIDSSLIDADDPYGFIKAYEEDI